MLGDSNTKNESCEEFDIEQFLINPQTQTKKTKSLNSINMSDLPL